MTLAIRPYQPEDAPAVLALLNQTRPIPMDLATYHQMDARDPQQFVARLVGEVDGHPVGYATLRRLPENAEGRLAVRVLVDGAQRCSGYGSALLRALEAAVGQGAPRGLEATVRDADAPSRAWAEHRGYSLERHQFDSELVLSRFDPTAHQAAIDRAEAAGIRFFSLADTPGEESLRKLHALYARLDTQTPDRLGQPPVDYERFSRYILGHPGFVARGTIIAADGDRWVGLSGVGRVSEDLMHTWFTGVDEEYRGRGLALALKVLSARFAREAGAQRMRTNNDSRNAPMLAVNQRLGYRPAGGTWWLVRSL